MELVWELERRERGKGKRNGGKGEQVAGRGRAATRKSGKGERGNGKRNGGKGDTLPELVGDHLVARPRRYLVRATRMWKEPPSPVVRSEPHSGENRDLESSIAALMHYARSACVSETRTTG
jgi:hypothetical protein